MNDESVSPAKIKSMFDKKKQTKQIRGGQNFVGLCPMKLAYNRPPKHGMALRELNRRSLKYHILLIDLSHLVFPMKGQLLTKGRLLFFF